MSPRMPVTYLPHGGGPWPFVDLGLPAREPAALRAWLEALPGTLPARPSAILCVTAHWEAPRVTVGAGASPGLLFDYYGFPDAAYRLEWAAPGAPALAGRVRVLLEEAGIPSAEDAKRGFDHGTFVPLMVAWPEGDVPVVQLSLHHDLDPAGHLALGRALAPLRDEGVAIVGSGMSFHNMRAFFGRGGSAEGQAFDAWVQRLVDLDPTERDAALVDWAAAPGARYSHPRPEHLLPLHVVAGAAGADPGRVAFRGTFGGQPITALSFG